MDCDRKRKHERRIDMPLNRTTFQDCCREFIDNFDPNQPTREQPKYLTDDEALAWKHGDELTRHEVVVSETALTELENLTADRVLELSDAVRRHTGKTPPDVDRAFHNLEVRIEAFFDLAHSISRSARLSWELTEPKQPSPPVDGMDSESASDS